MALFYLPSLEMENDITYFVAAAAYSFQECPSLKSHISFIESWSILKCNNNVYSIVSLTPKYFS